MRALLIAFVLSAWVTCIVGVVGLTGFLVIDAIRTRRASAGAGEQRVRTRPPRIVTSLLAGYAATMLACAAAIAFLTMADDERTLYDVVRWAGLPTWSTVAAIATIVVLERRPPVSLAEAAGGPVPLR